ncbi:unnamed protein product [Macrosiphum euphorbiae]|uniref:mitogen-activated protein kinase kinase n=1 Tax=Macrosiphum euphorbiae TaxID=13131 RepID=A0AAV0W843_9HEMI|nr:unnamed protein product [Macrosiphum euphorbiae]
MTALFDVRRNYRVKMTRHPLYIIIFVRSSMKRCFLSGLSAKQQEQLADISTKPPPRTRFQELREMHRKILKMCQSIQSIGKLKLSENKVYDFTSDDLKDLGGIGRGGFGTMNKIIHHSSDTLMTVQRISGVKENEKFLMDLDVVMKFNECPYIVQFYGVVFKDWDCWICMEAMDTSLEKLYKYAYERLNQQIPEKILGKITVASVKALNYRKKNLKITPSNILLDCRGNIKLSDFGLPGQYSIDTTSYSSYMSYCYMAPEKIDPNLRRRVGYDVSSDVWALGITLVEVATGQLPYSTCSTVFQQACQILKENPPRLRASDNFSPNFVNFVNTCLIKDVNQRPKNNELLEHLFIKGSDAESVDVASYVGEIMDAMANDGKKKKKKPMKTSKCTLV